MKSIDRSLSPNRPKRLFGILPSGFLARVNRGIQRHGILGAFRIAAGRMVEFAGRLRPAVRAKIKQGRQREIDFDERFGVDTSGFLHPTDLNLNSANHVHAVSYGGSDPKDFREAIEALNIDYGRFVFIDFGSGKGRAILLATEFPFKKIVGVEFSEVLHNIATENIKRFRSDIARCTNIEAVCMDVMEYALPNDPLVCYFCNPFDETLMARVASNIRSSFIKKPRTIFIVYYNAKAAHLFDRCDCFRRVQSDVWARIWRTDPGSTVSRFPC
jgi:tRNA G46 methylase TrmB